MLDAKTGKLIHVFPEHTNRVDGVCFSPDGKLLATTTTRGAIIWNIETRQEVRTLEGDSWTVLDVAFSPNATRVAAAGEDKSIRVWDAATGRELLVLRGHKAPVNSVVRWLRVTERQSPSGIPPHAGRLARNDRA